MGDCKQHTLELEWVARIREGDELAFEKLFFHYYLPLTRFAWRYTDSKAIAEDLVQDLLQEIWENRVEWAPVGKLRPFLYLKVKQKCLNYLKRRQIMRVHDDRWTEEWTDTVFFPEESDREEQLQAFQQAVGRAVEKLPLRCKMIFKMHKFDGLTHKEIAEVMQLSSKTVEFQLNKALKLLREKLSKDINTMLLVLFVFLVG